MAELGPLSWVTDRLEDYQREVIDDKIKGHLVRVLASPQGRRPSRRNSRLLPRSFSRTKTGSHAMPVA